MTDIRNYPNPLLQAFSDQFNLGVRFDANGVPTFNGNKVSLAQFQSFFDTALTNQENLYRLMPDGSVTRPTIKTFYDGQTKGVFNSVLANDFVERTGSSAVSIDKTKLGQFLFRSQLENVVDGLDKTALNRQLSAAYA